MDWKKLAGELRNEFTDVRVRAGGGKVLVPPAPVDLHALLTGAVETEEEYEEAIEESGAGNALILRNHFGRSHHERS